MNKQISDEQLDQLMRTLLADASADDAVIEEIVDSPKLWWAVQRQINDQKDTVRPLRVPVDALRRWLMFGLPAMTAAALIVSIFVLRPAVLFNEEAIGDRPQAMSTEVIDTFAGSESVPFDGNSNIAPGTTVPATVATKARSGKKRTSVRPSSMGTAVKETAVSVIKTDFIALSYAGNPESGQIVRVRVPSSMMVTLGLMASVEKPTDLVDAEVVVGDDGLTRAIRFIR